MVKFLHANACLYLSTPQVHFLETPLIPKNRKCFVSCSFTFLIITLAKTVSSLVDEGTVRYIKLQLSCSFSVDEGTVPPINLCLFKCMYSSCT